MARLSFYGDFVVRHVSNLEIDGLLGQKIHSSDFNVINFEAPVQSSNPPCLKFGSSVLQDVCSPNWLSQNDFNVFSLANNHIMDFGEKAARETEATLGHERCVGIGVGKEAYKPLLLEREGVKVAILALAELQFGMIHDSFTQNEEYGCAWLNHPCVNRLVRETKKKVDFLITEPTLKRGIF